MLEKVEYKKVPVGQVFKINPHSVHWITKEGEVSIYRGRRVIIASNSPVYIRPNNA